MTVYWTANGADEPLVSPYEDGIRINITADRDIEEAVATMTVPQRVAVERLLVSALHFRGV